MKLLVGREQNTSRLTWKLSVIKVSRLMCSQDFISELVRTYFAIYTLSRKYTKTCAKTRKCMVSNLTPCSGA